MTSFAEEKANKALSETTIEDVKKFLSSQRGQAKELENLDQKDYGKLLKLREKFLGEDIFKQGSFGNSFYDAIIKNQIMCLTIRVKDMWNL